MTTVVWFRQDLRLADNPALSSALATGGGVIPLYLHAPTEEGDWPPGGAACWWLHHSLGRLHRDLIDCGSSLCLRRADDSLDELLSVCRDSGASRVLWNRRYEPASVARDRRIKAALRAAGIETGSFNGALLHEPWSVETKTGGPFQVFTPFWRHCKSLPEPADPLPAPARLPSPPQWPASVPLDDLGLLPSVDWAAGLRESWEPGSAAAARSVQRFLNEGFDTYDEGRNLPGVRGTSRLSPHLHFGEISPRQIWHATRRHAQGRGRHTTWRDSQFLAEVGWREFAHHLLYHFPHTPERPLRSNYERFPWVANDARLRAWCKGSTGYPIVDAGMRELWHTGWMHNRVRMITASFLIKDLLISWSTGARWFWDTLVDADLASNTLGWQWVAGCGADAAPFFRIFNPTTQGTKFDPLGEYVRRWVPELARLDTAWIHQPWAAPASSLAAAGVELGRNYPLPIVEHETARRDALKALSVIKTP